MKRTAIFLLSISLSSNICVGRWPDSGSTADHESPPHDVTRKAPPDTNHQQWKQEEEEERLKLIEDWNQDKDSTYLKVRSIHDAMRGLLKYEPLSEELFANLKKAKLSLEEAEELIHQSKRLNGWEKKRALGQIDILRSEALLKNSTLTSSEKEMVKKKLVPLLKEMRESAEDDAKHLSTTAQIARLLGGQIPDKKNYSIEQGLLDSKSAFRIESGIKGTGDLSYKAIATGSDFAADKVATLIKPVAAISDAVSNRKETKKFGRENHDRLISNNADLEQQPSTFEKYSIHMPGKEPFEVVYKPSSVQRDPKTGKSIMTYVHTTKDPKTGKKITTEYRRSFYTNPKTKEGYYTLRPVANGKPQSLPQGAKVFQKIDSIVDLSSNKVIKASGDLQDDGNGNLRNSLGYRYAASGKQSRKSADSLVGDIQSTPAQKYLEDRILNAEKAVQLKITREREEAEQKVQEAALREKVGQENTVIDAGINEALDIQLKTREVISKEGDDIVVRGPKETHSFTPVKIKSGDYELYLSTTPLKKEVVAGIAVNPEGGEQAFYSNDIALVQEVKKAEAEAKKKATKPPVRITAPQQVGPEGSRLQFTLEE